MEQDVQFRILEASTIEARVAVQYSGIHPAHTELAGTISGPTLKSGRTLPATIALQPITSAAAPAAAAILPDPCYWSPERPFLYDVSLELRRGDQVVDSAAFSIALHRKRVVKQ